MRADAIQCWDFSTEQIKSKSVTFSSGSQSANHEGSKGTPGGKRGIFTCFAAMANLLMGLLKYLNQKPYCAIDFSILTYESPVLLKMFFSFRQRTQEGLGTNTAEGSAALSGWDVMKTIFLRHKITTLRLFTLLSPFASVPSVLCLICRT